VIRNEELFDLSLPAGFDGRFEWDFLKPAFRPTRIEPMDLDAVIERHGQFLVFETKRFPDTPIPEGQRITLNALLKTGRFTVFVLRGKTADTISSLLVCYPGSTMGTGKHKQPADARYVIERTRAWFKWASAKPPPSPEEWEDDAWLQSYERASERAR